MAPLIRRATTNDVLRIRAIARAIGWRWPRPWARPSGMSAAITFQVAQSMSYVDKSDIFW
jgi:hypothetical protein